MAGLRAVAHAGSYAADLSTACSTPALASLRKLYAAMPMRKPEDSSYAAEHVQQHSPRFARQGGLNSSKTVGKRPRALDLDSIPMLNVPQTCSGSSEAGSAGDWREAVYAAQHAPPLGNMLTDTFRRFHSYLRISLTERCNLRCQYCMPADGVDLAPAESMLTTAEITRLVRRLDANIMSLQELLIQAGLFVHEGVNKIRLTGGEPTVRRDIVSISQQLAQLPGLQTLAMTTNGIALARQLPALREAGMSALNISLDTLQEARFVELTRRQGSHRVLGAIRAAAAQGFQVKVNNVMMRGMNDDELLDFVELTRHLPINVRFIEFMPFDDNEWSSNKMVSYREMMQQIEQAHGPLQRCADPRGEVAKNFTLPGFAGSVSFVTSMTEHFCSDCNRLRLMADGNLKVCLFGANEVSLRDAMREGATDQQLRSVISAAVKRKRFAHANMDVLAATKNRPMIQIGG